MNCDAAFKDGITAMSYVLQNHLGLILGAWTYHFVSNNPFCSKLEMIVQTLQQATMLQLEKATIEEDASNVILAIQVLDDFVDWKARVNIVLGKKLLRNQVLWQLQYTSRSCNSLAHNLAKWEKGCFICPLPTKCLDPSLWREA